MIRAFANSEKKRVRRSGYFGPGWSRYLVIGSFANAATKPRTACSASAGAAATICMTPDVRAEAPVEIPARAKR